MNYLTEQQQAERKTRRFHQMMRQVARNTARSYAIDALTRLVGEDAPDWFTVEQQIAFKSELRRMIDRATPRSEKQPHANARADEYMRSLARGRA